MTRVLSYNILAGGYNVRNNTRRTEQLIKVIRAAQPDVVGFPEGIHQQMTERPIVVEEIAEALGMQLIKGGPPACSSDYQTALLTRLPIVYTKSHERPGLARPLLEVCVEEPDGQQLTVFLTHLSAAFNHGWAGSQIRMREMRMIIDIMAPLRAENRPHLLMGDFNSLAPKDAFKASNLLKYVVRLDNKLPVNGQNDGNPHMDSVLPPQLHILAPVLRYTAQHEWLCSLFDRMAYFYAPRGCIQLVGELYEDCFRYKYPQEPGFTCPAAAPAGRIDYIFANQILAERVRECFVVSHGEDDLPARMASDHLPVCVDFAPVPATLSAVHEMVEEAATHQP